MPVIAAVLFILIFFVFFAMGFISHHEKKSRKWIYFTLSGIGLISTLLVFDFYNWDLGKGLKNNEPARNELKKNNRTAPDINQHANPDKETSPAENTPPPIPPQKSSAPGLGTLEMPVPSNSEEIVIPGSGSVDYRVVKGDTLWSISARSGVTPAKIKQWNSLTSDTIYAGQILKLYGKDNEPQAPVNRPNPDTPSAAPSQMTYHGNLLEKKIALTFDAGSDIAGIQILDVLKKHSIKATFFLTGKWAEKFPSYAKRIADEGHEIGNHSYSHPDSVKISPETLKQEISKAEQVIKTASGKSPRPYFRFPFGSYNATALKTVGESGYPLSIQWSLDTIDWQQPPADTIVSRIEAGASNGDIILMHIGGINTPDAVDRVIPILQAQGYQLVTLSDLFN